MMMMMMIMMMMLMMMMLMMMMITQEKTKNCQKLDGEYDNCYYEHGNCYCEHDIVEQMFIFFAYLSKAPENDKHLLQDK